MNSPIFVCAHRCNTTKWVDDAVNKNFNAVETDIWKNNKEEIWACHDWTAPGTKIDEFLNYLKQSIFGTNKGDSIVMWIWDLKDTMTTDDIKSLRKKINDALPSKVYKFYCVTDDNRSKLESIVSDFGDYEGINYDANYFHEDTQIEDVLSWKDDNNVKNLIYSCGIDPLPAILVDDDKIEKSLIKAVQLRNSGKNFGIYSWTFNNLDNSKKWLKSLLLNGIMGNSNWDFGSLPKKLPNSLCLGTQDDGVNAWRYAETNPNLNIVGLAFKMNNWNSDGTWVKHQETGNQDGDEKWVADGYCWNSDLNDGKGDSGYGESLIYLGKKGPFYSIVGGYTENDKDGTIDQWGKQDGDEKFLLSHGYRDNWYYVYHYVYLVKNDIVDSVSGFEVTSDGSYVYDVGSSTSEKQKWGHLNAYDGKDGKGNHYFYVYLDNETKVNSQDLEDEAQQSQAQIQISPKD